MKSPITDASRMTAIRKLSPFFLIVCRIGNLNCQFGWLRGSLKSKNLLVKVLRAACFSRRGNFDLPSSLLPQASS
jgi:hypothetical protein